MRVQRQTRNEWKSTLAAQQASGLSEYEYCANHNIHIKTFYAQRSEMNTKAVQPISKLVKVLKSTSHSRSTTSSLTFTYNGVTPNVVPVAKAQWLADVIQALAS